jgi:hypothetical protein
MREQIGRAQLVARRKKEEGSAGAVRDAKLAQRLHHRLRAMPVGRDREHAKCVLPELPLVLFGGMRRQVRAHFFFEAGLSEGIRSHHRHGAAVNLDHKGRSKALLFEPLDANFKLQPPINLPVLEVAELFVYVVDLGFEAVDSCSERCFNF